MLIFDQLKKDDPQLRVVAAVILSGLGVLVAGLWWVQIVSAREYRESLETQAFRTVRIPAVRGKILDRNGVVLAENRPTYNVSLYPEELRNAFAKDFAQSRPVRVLTNRLHFWQSWLGFEAVKTQYVKLKKDQFQGLTWESRCRVASNVVMQIGRRLHQPVAWDPHQFQHHYETRLALPFTIIANLDSTNIARFEEQSTSPLGVDLEIQSTRFYPCGSLAAHVLGRLHRDDDSAEGEESFFSYRLPDYKGEVGVEAGYDKELRGMAGAKSVLVNNVGYRQSENIWTPAEPGHNVVLTLDAHVQQAAEHALRTAPVSYPAPVRGAVVVMDVWTGDILAMASSPTLDPNGFIPKISSEEWHRISQSGAEKNRATQENYMPGSIFKTVVGLAALEAGLNPRELVKVPPNPRRPDRGCYIMGNRIIKDTAPPADDYDFRKALKLSCNTYFITMGLRTRPERIIRLAQHLHFGERTGLPTRQEVAGHFPDLSALASGWSDGKTANLSIGADPAWITPLQITVLTCALANRGRVLWPRLVDRIEPLDPTSGESADIMPHRPPRDNLGVSQRSLDILYQGMLADTEDSDGTGHHVRDRDPLTGLRICAKTGTAEVQDENNHDKTQTTWFASFAPFEKPRWAVVVMVEGGNSGGGTCAPVAGEVYKALLESNSKAQTLAGTAPR